MRPLMPVAFVCLLLAGCADYGTPTSAPKSLDASSYTVSVAGLPAMVAPGAAFTLTVTVSGSPASQSTHLGAHFGPNATATPSTTVYSSSCVHTAGSLPGTFTTSCTAPMAAGTYHLRGHARVQDGNATLNWWGPDQTFTVSAA